MQDNLINQFIRNLKLAGGEILEEIPKNWYTTHAKFAIAENGAVFVENYTKELFLSEEVAIILDKNEIYEKIMIYFNNRVDVVLSDMAANTSGNKTLDSYRTGELCLNAMNLAIKIIELTQAMWLLIRLLIFGSKIYF